MQKKMKFFKEFRGCVHPRRRPLFGENMAKVGKYAVAGGCVVGASRLKEERGKSKTNKWMPPIPFIKKEK
ncbi:hypothetical protein PL329_17945 [Escherichia coli]|uniref:hypothetical protein n=1 Tax=Escherichia coli TaxID=562 RepID=UPI00230811E4|nr:hypothetical protein [Escherichia coli]WCE52861.1 hypothetical protein PL329_17945 [Escherichia coli]